MPSDLIFINWEFGNGFPSNEINPTTVYQFPGNYDVAVDIFDATNDCIYNGITTITIEDCGPPCTNLPDLNIFSADMIQCVGVAYFFFTQTSAELVEYQWFLNDILTAEGSDTFAPVSTEIGSATVSLLAIDVDGCEYEAIFEFEVIDCDDPCEDFDIGLINVEGDFCVDSLLTFSNSIPAIEAAYLWTFDNGETFFDQNFTTVFSEETTITTLLQVVNAEGCEDEATFEFSIENCESIDDCLFPPNSVYIGFVPDLSYCVGDSVQWSFGTEENINVTSVIWQVSDGQISTDLSPYISIIDTGFIEITLEAIDENGCIYLDTIAGDFYQSCEEICQVFVPNAFTPNADNVNDRFKPLSHCNPESYTFEIYSRWGELLFQTKNFNESWDGMHRGKPVPSSVYAWVMNYSFSGQTSETVVGDISLIR